MASQRSGMPVDSEETVNYVTLRRDARENISYCEGRMEPS
jgi:hypothetical protein